MSSLIFDGISLHVVVVVTGVSGLGKSTLAFDIIYTEGHRRYVEAFSAYARQFLDHVPDGQSDIHLSSRLAWLRQTADRFSRMGTLSQ